jgi:hypothetical protein
VIVLPTYTRSRSIRRRSADPAELVDVQGPLFSGRSFRVEPIAVGKARPFFFLSYVHDMGEDDESVRLLFARLHHDVVLYSGLRGETVGFCDTALRAGDRWSSALLEALCTCTAFIPLCSPAYFNSVACGREWAIFEKRIHLRSAGRNGGSSLVPVMWVRMEMPAIAAPFQYRDRAFGPAYEEHGLRDLIQIRDYEAGYRRFVSALARRIVALAGTVTVPPYPDRPAFDQVSAAFPVAAGRAGGQFRTGADEHPKPPVENSLDPQPPQVEPDEQLQEQVMPRLYRWHPPRTCHSAETTKDKPQ